MKIFTKDRQLTPSWQLVNPSIELARKHMWPIVYLAFLPSLLLNVAQVMLHNGENFASGARFAAGVAVSIIAGLWLLLAAPGFIYLQTRAIRSEQPDTWIAFRKGLSRLLPFIITAVLSTILLVFGFLLFIIPGLFLLRGLFLAQYYVIDQDISPVQALKQSYRDSKSVSAWIWGVIGVQVVFALAASFAGILPVVGPIIGLVISFMIIFAPALRYGEVAHNIMVAKRS